jgi:hypothetical protein
MTLVYDAGWQGKKVRGLIWFLQAFAVLCFWLAFLEPAVLPPPEVETAAERLFASAFAITAGLVASLGILVYGRCYIGRLEVEDDGTLRIRTVGPIGSPEHVLQPDDIVSGVYRDGYLRANGQTVNAPWFTVRLRGRRLPLILDPQGDVLDADRTEQALGIEPGELAIWELPPPPFESTPVPKPVLSEKERKRIKQARRRR